MHLYKSVTKRFHLRLFTLLWVLLRGMHNVLCLPNDYPAVPGHWEATGLCFPKYPSAHRVPFILLACDLSTKYNSAELTLVLYCLTCK